MAIFESNLTKLILGAEAAASAALLQTAKDIYDISQQFVPVDSGDLKASGGIDVVSNHEVHIGYGVGLPTYASSYGVDSYANAQEFGTVNMAAQPYLVPAFAQTEETFKVRLTEAMVAATK